LRPWKRLFTTIISAWWLRTNSKLTGKKSTKNGKLGNWQFLSERGFVQDIAPPSLFYDRIKIEKLNEYLTAFIAYSIREWKKNKLKTNPQKKDRHSNWNHEKLNSLRSTVFKARYNFLNSCQVY